MVPIGDRPPRTVDVPNRVCHFSETRLGGNKRYWFCYFYDKILTIWLGTIDSETISPLIEPYNFMKIFFCI